MNWPPRNLDYLQRKDPRLYEAISDLVNGVSTMAQQGNLNPSGNPVAPSRPTSMKVTGQNGHFQVSIQDGNQMYRGVQYQIEHADNPHFLNPQRVTLGPSRTANLYLGNATRYFRAVAFYDSSNPSPYVYHGNPGAPQPVSAGGDNGGPAFLDDEGSGTGLPGQPGGPGPVPFRSGDGTPPTRGSSSATGGSSAGSGGKSVINPSAVGIVSAVPSKEPAAQSQPITVPASALILGSTSGRQLTPTALASGSMFLGNSSNTPAAVAVPASALVTATNSTSQFIAATLASAKFWVGNSLGQVAAVLMSGDATMSNAGAVTVTGINGAVVPGSASVLGSNSSGQLVAQTVATLINVILTPVAVSALPGSPVSGEMAAVNNALAPVAGHAIVGGGLQNALVWWNGSQWTVIGV